MQQSNDVNIPLVHAWFCREAEEKSQQSSSGGGTYNTAKLFQL